MKSTIYKLLVGTFMFALIFTSCFKDDLLREIDDLRTTIVQMQKRSDSLSNVLNLRADSLAKALTNTQKRSDSLSNVLRTKSDSLSQALGITNSNLSALGKSVDSIKTQISSINAQLTQLNSQLTSITSQLSQLNQQLTTLSGNVATLTAQYQTLSASLQTINAQIAALQAEQAKLLEKLNAILLILNPPVDITTGLVAYYPFSGNAADSSGNGNHGQVNGATLTTDRFGTSNKAYQFNSTNKIVLPIVQSNVNNYSVCGWFKTSTGGVVLGGRAIVGSPGLSLVVHNSSLSAAYVGQILWENDNAYGGVGQMSRLNYLDNNWHFIVGTFSNSTQQILPSDFKIYVDGVLLNSLTVNSSNPTPTSPVNNGNSNLIIGNHQIWSSSGFIAGFLGTLDDIRIYNRVLTQSEITYLATH